MQRLYTVAREGFLMNTYKKVGDKVLLHERQAVYLIHAGQIDNPVKAPTVAEQAAAAFAANAEAVKA